MDYCIAPKNASQLQHNAKIDLFEVGEPKNDGYIHLKPTDVVTL